MKELVRRFFRALGADVRPARHVRDLIDFVKDRQIDTVLDVGANVGQFGASLRAKGYRGRIVSFEPVVSVFQTLVARARADGNWEAYHCALGAETGEAIIHVAEFSVFSSILASTAAATEFDCGAVTARTEATRVRTLDEVARDLSGNILLKIDTQGYEKQVLDGGRQTLPRLKGILMELPIVQLYEGNWQFHEALEFMAAAGFIPAQMQAVNYGAVDKVSLVEVDCLFRPRDGDSVKQSSAVGELAALAVHN
jgi:FkbM family methyltransferase